MPVSVPKIDYYALLELEKGATEDDIRAAYKKMALKWHPDRHTDNKDEAQEKFIEIKEAYLHLLEECRKHKKRRGRKPKPEPAKSSAASVHTTSSASSKRSRSEHAQDGAKPDKNSKRHTKERSRRPPDSSHHPPKKPSKLSKPSPLHADRHEHRHFTSMKSEHDAFDDEHKKKPSSPSKAHSNLDDTDYELVDMVDLGSPLKPLHSPFARDVPLPSTSTSSASASASAPTFDNDWLFPLPLTLEELYSGAHQRYRITRELRSGQTQSVKLDVRVSPSWRDGARVRLPGLGNERADGTFQDIVFVVEEVPHDVFERGAGHDLHVALQVPWRDARTRPRPRSSSSDATEEDEEDETETEAVYVRALDGKEYALPIPGSLAEAADGTRVIGMGMPIRKHGKTIGHGDLIVKWEFVYQETEKRQRIRWQDLKRRMPNWI